MLSSFKPEKTHLFTYLGFLFTAAFYVIVIASIQVESLRELPSLIPGILAVVSFIIAGHLLFEARAYATILWKLLGLHLVLSTGIYVITTFILEGLATNGFDRFLGMLSGSMILAALVFMAGFLVMGALILRVVDFIQQRGAEPAQADG